MDVPVAAVYGSFQMLQLLVDVGILPGIALVDENLLQLIRLLKRTNDFISSSFHKGTVDHPVEGLEIWYQGPYLKSSGRVGPF